MLHIQSATMPIHTVDNHGQNISLEPASLSLSSSSSTTSPPSFSSVIDTQFQMNWFDSNMTDYTELRKWRCENVDRGTGEFDSIKRQLLESMTEGIAVSSIRRIEHSLFFKRFLERGNEVMMKQNGDPNVQRLWHGTSGTPFQTILSSESGLDALRSGGGFYGRGIYLAEHARYSNGDKNGDTGRDYFTINQETEERELLLVLATCGNPQEYGPRFNKELDPAKDLIDTHRSTKHIEVRFDSVRGGPHCPSQSGPGPNDSMISVLYNNASVYPAYVVSFKKMISNSQAYLDDDTSDEDGAYNFKLQPPLQKPKPKPKVKAGSSKKRKRSSPRRGTVIDPYVQMRSGKIFFLEFQYLQRRGNAMKSQKKDAREEFDRSTKEYEQLEKEFLDIQIAINDSHAEPNAVQAQLKIDLNVADKKIVAMHKKR